MILSYLKVALRNLVRHKLYTLINVLGLAIGIGFCILIILFIQDEHSYDTFHARGDRLFRILIDTRTPGGETRREAYVPMPLIPALLDEIPGIVHGARFTTGNAVVKYRDRMFREDMVFTDPVILSMFTFPLVAGDSSAALREPNGIVLNETAAKKYFGDENPMGKWLTVEILGGKKSDFLVTGVMRNQPPTSSLKFNFLLSTAHHELYERAKDRWTVSIGSAYVELSPGTDPAALAAKLGPFVRDHFAAAIASGIEDGTLDSGPGALRLAFQPIADIHLDMKTAMAPEERSDPAYSYILGAIGAFVLLIACINFTTLAIARSAGRAREVGVRKVLGAVRPQLIKQFWGEALMLCLIALVAGVVFAEVALPTFNEITRKQLSPDSFGGWWFLGALAGILTMVALAAGSYPAVFLSRFEPVEILKGKLRIAGRTPLTRILIVVQFTLSILLIVSTMVLSDQMTYILGRDLGYDAEQVVVLQLFNGSGNSGVDRAQRLKAELASDTDVLGVSGTSAAFTHGTIRHGYKFHGENRTAYMYNVDEQFIPVLGIILLEGRNFNPAAPGEDRRAVIVNEALVRDCGIPDPVVGTRLAGWNETDAPGGPVIIGVVKDFNFGSLREAVRPVVLSTNSPWGMGHAMIRISPRNIPATMERLRAVWTKIAPDKPFNATLLNEDVQEQYEKEQRWMEILRSASAMAIALACMGLFGLAGLSVVNRTKEIGIRKVMGASVPGIAAMLSKEFAVLVIVSNVLAIPAAFYAASRFLESYAYRVELGPAVFILGGLGALLIALATVSVHAVRASRTNPVDSLRYE